MKIDLHIHSKEGSDGRMALEDIFHEAVSVGIDFISVTDHDSMECQAEAVRLASRHRIQYITGLELNISFSHPGFRDGKPVSLDCLGYGIDVTNTRLAGRLEELRSYRRKRAELIMDKLNEQLRLEGKPLLSSEDARKLDESVDGTFGRPHIADYLVGKGLAVSRQEAFDRYLVKCNVPKMPVTLEEASGLIRGAGGLAVLAHPGNPRGTSLVSMAPTPEGQQKIIAESMIPYLDGLECWNSGHDEDTALSYLEFSRHRKLIATGGSDCHQQPLVMGSVDVPAWVAGQLGLKSRKKEI